MGICMCPLSHTAKQSSNEKQVMFELGQLNDISFNPSDYSCNCSCVLKGHEMCHLDIMSFFLELLFSSDSMRTLIL